LNQEYEEEEEFDEEESDVGGWLTDTPYWLISIALHAIVLFILGSVVVLEIVEEEEQRRTVVKKEIKPPKYDPTKKRDIERKHDGDAALLHVRFVMTDLRPGGGEAEQRQGGGDQQEPGELTGNILTDEDLAATLADEEAGPVTAPAQGPDANRDGAERARHEEEEDWRAELH